MTVYLKLFVLFVLVPSVVTGCGESGNPSTDIPEERIVSRSFQTILDSRSLEGSILVFEPTGNIFYSNDFEWSSTGFLPASTFKIPNSIIALEMDIVESDSTVFRYDGEARRLPQWERDLTLAEAYAVSCVPCYQEIARSVGVDSMRFYLDRFKYGNIDVTEETLDQFWLQGSSRITQFQQIDFLRRFVDQQFPMTPDSYEAMLKIMTVLEGELTILGKTGWSVSGSEDNGWFVGLVDSEAGRYYFATNVTPGEGYDLEHFADDRKHVTLLALFELGVVPTVDLSI